MLTGDKVETATNIAISTGLKARKNQLFFLREILDPNELLDRFNELHRHIRGTTVIIDGKTLDTVLNNEEVMDRFFNLVI